MNLRPFRTANSAFTNIADGQRIYCSFLPDWAAARETPRIQNVLCCQVLSRPRTSRTTTPQILTYTALPYSLHMFTFIETRTFSRLVREYLADKVKGSISVEILRKIREEIDDDQVS